MTQKEYEKYFGGFPLTRAKISGLKRNALIAMVVTQDSQLKQALKNLSNDKNIHELLRNTIKQIPLYQESLK